MGWLRLGYGLCATVVLILDQWSKWFAETALLYGEPVVVAPWLNWLLIYNQGAAFSFLAGAGGWQRWLFLLLAVVVSSFLTVALWRLRAADRLLGLAYSCIVGGALGNLLDRARLGYVVDFVQLHYRGYYWPAFNVADSAITVGVGLWCWHLWCEYRADSTAV